MEKKEQFLVKFIKFGGILEIGLAFMFMFFGPLIKYFEVLCKETLPQSGMSCNEYVFGFFDLQLGIPFFYTFAGIELLILGYLLWYSARNIETYLAIIIASCAFRFMMPLWPELHAIITLWPNPFAMVLIPAMIYDVVSAIITLVLLKQCGYLQRK